MSTATPTNPVSPAPGAARYGGRLGITLAVILCSQFMVGLDSTVVNIALPRIHDALHFTPTGLAWVTSAYMLSFGGLLLLGGRVGDILGRRRMFIAGLLLFAAASLLGGFAPTSGWLLAARVAQGVGAALAAPNSLALITTNFPEGPQRNRALGAVAGSYAASLVLGLIAGGMLVAWASWRWVMFINVPIAVVVLILAPLFINEAPRHPGRFDVPGGVLSTAGMGTLVYGFLHAASAGWNNTVTIGTLAASVVLVAGFVAVETRTEHPITPLRLLANRNRSAAYLNLMILTGPMAAMNFFVTQLVQTVLHYSPLSAGVAFLPMAAGLMVAGGLTAQAMQRIPRAPIVIFGSALIVVGMVWLAQISVTSSYLGGVVGPITLFGAGAGIAFTALNEVILSGVSPQDSGAASSLLEATQWIGSVLGLSILVTIFGTAARSATLHPATGLTADQASHYALVHGMGMVFVASLAFIGAALIVTVLGIPRGPVAPAAGATADGDDEVPAAAPVGAQ